MFSSISKHAQFLPAGDASYSSPLTPAELLMSLHNIDPNKCDMKTIIKGKYTSLKIQWNQYIQ